MSIRNIGLREGCGENICTQESRQKIFHYELISVFNLILLGHVARMEEEGMEHSHREMPVE
jgi:hypothetical protein